MLNFRHLLHLQKRNKVQLLITQKCEIVQFHQNSNMKQVELIRYFNDQFETRNYQKKENNIQ